MSTISFDYHEAEVCKSCKKGFLGKQFSHCPFCGNKLEVMKGY